MEHNKGIQREKGRAGAKHLDLSEAIASNQVGEAFGTSRLLYSIRLARGTNPRGEKYCVGIIGWTLRKRNALVTFHNSSMSLAPMSLQLADAGVRPWK
jgi:hypothetical protein